MGVCFSIEHSLKPSGFSGKAIMVFVYERSGTFKSVSFLDFIDSPSSFSNLPVVIIEPTHGARPPVQKMAISKHVSYVETVRELHQTFKVSQFKFASFRLWLLIAESLSNPFVSDAISNCRTYPFADFFSTKAVSADDVFLDVSSVMSFAATFKPPSQCGALRSSSPLRTAAQLNSNTFIVRRSHDAVALQTTFHVPSIETANPITKANDCDFVISGLFIGGEAAARNKALLNRLGITHIVNLNSGESLIDEFQNITYCSILLNDSVFEDLTQEFWDAVHFIDNAIKHDGTVLVHCRRGISRSAALCAAYLIDCRGMSLDAAVSFIKKQRPIININQGFMEQLQMHEEEKLRENRFSSPHTPRFGLRLSVF